MDECYIPIMQESALTSMQYTRYQLNNDTTDPENNNNIYIRLLTIIILLITFTFVFRYVSIQF